MDSQVLQLDCSIYEVLGIFSDLVTSFHKEKDNFDNRFIAFMNQIKKIILTGPESTGKTTLAKHLAAYYQTSWVPEFAREYLEKLNRAYRYSDLLTIAEGQLGLEKKQEISANQFLFCDTSMLVMKVWAEYKYQRCHGQILEELEKRKNEVYILCGIDIPWEYDKWRENPRKREDLYEIYKKELLHLKAPFMEVHGTQRERVRMVVEFLKNQFPESCLDLLKT